MRKILLGLITILFTSCFPDKDAAVAIIRSKTPKCSKIVWICGVSWKAADYYVSSDSSGNIYKWVVMFDGRTELIKE
jgi:hypothetical protein